MLSLCVYWQCVQAKALTYSSFSCRQGTQCLPPHPPLPPQTLPTINPTHTHIHISKSCKPIKCFPHYGFDSHSPKVCTSTEKAFGSEGNVMQVTVQQHVRNIITALKGEDSWAQTLCMHGSSCVERIQVLFGGQT